MVFREIDRQFHSFWQSVESSKEFVQKNLEATLLLVDFSKAFDSLYREKMEQILLAYVLLKEAIYCYNDALEKHESKGSFIW